MDTLIYLGIGITLGIIAFIIQARKAAQPEHTVYEPVGVIPGIFKMTIGDTFYVGIDNTDGTTDIYANGEYISTHTSHEALLAIIDHAKDQK